MTPEISFKPDSNKAANEKHFILPLLSLFFLTLISSPVVSQKTMELGLYGGVSYYLEIWIPECTFRVLRSVMVSWLDSTLIQDGLWKLIYFGGKVKGSSQSSAFLPERNLSFESPVTDISATAEFNFLKYFTGSRRDFISPYIYTGISAFFYDPVANGYSLRSLGTEGQNIGYEGRNLTVVSVVAIPFGRVLKSAWQKNLGMTIFWEMHKTFTDYLDDVSQTYYLNSQTIDPDDPRDIPVWSFNGSPARDGKRGSENKDWYSFRFDINI